ncbi:HD-GYP domain-containing protein [Desulfuribacillus alkaliarsenatis]|uniref:Phosphohydrolase n=1 Tax=Desulfuribacillus alkaliarsenatis TaxID=766136 RepID=A0A1E5G5J5_9FIRM|nr:HD domain-containing phosphohydrolase [Desulfuribacillus alkaliarsenatis]OEF98460.1 phosphohydrolase [Desulfuribacillus alkaliarsenatis]
MNRDLQISLFDLVISLSNAMDLISPEMVNHHKRVAYASLKIAQQMNLSAEEINDVVLASTVHDVGALSYNQRINARQYEFSNASEHAELGFLLLSNFSQMRGLAEQVRFHHLPWSNGNGKVYDGQNVPIGAHIIHLADRIEILINREDEILGQVDRIVKVINNGKDKVYHPDIVEAFLQLKDKEYFWLDLTSPMIGDILAKSTDISLIQLEIDDLLEFTKLFSQIIDFRSSMTATHSSGVAYTGEALASYIGFSERECKMMRIAGYLHDLGKLAIPDEILEKPDKLDEQEINIMRSHTYHTHRILEVIPGLEQITEWASFHHEKLNGSGYPFKYTATDITLGSRIMAVADVFTAIAEERPYRCGLEREVVLNILHKMVDDNALDKLVVSILEDNYEEINRIRIDAQAEAYRSYKNFGNRLVNDKMNAD